MQLSFSFLLCTIHFEAEQKERNDRVVTHDSPAKRARHRPPDLLDPPTCCLRIPLIARVVGLQCALWATLRSDLSGYGIKPRGNLRM